MSGAMDPTLQAIFWIVMLLVGVRIVFGGKSKTEQKPAPSIAATPPAAPQFTGSDEARVRAIVGAVVTLQALTPNGAWILITPGGAPVTAESAAQIASVALMLHHASLGAEPPTDKEPPTP